MFLLKKILHTRLFFQTQRNTAMEGQQGYNKHLQSPATKKEKKWTIWMIKIWH